MRAIVGHARRCPAPSIRLIHRHDLLIQVGGHLDEPDYCTVCDNYVQCAGKCPQRQRSKAEVAREIAATTAREQAEARRQARWATWERAAAAIMLAAVAAGVWYLRTHGAVR